jgi:hypothetical protein
MWQSQGPLSLKSQAAAPVLDGVWQLGKTHYPLTENERMARPGPPDLQAAAPDLDRVWQLGKAYNRL